jgi:hypothetical protein
MKFDMGVMAPEAARNSYFLISFSTVHSSNVTDARISEVEATPAPSNSVLK